ncbi:MAG: hypothetical protein WC334_05270 [Kiritimatiellales bacterium]
MMKIKTLILICAVSAALSSSAAENIIYYSLFDTVGWWQPSDAAKAWEISSEIPGTTTGKALKIIPKFGPGTDRRIMLLNQIPFIRAHKIRLRLWNAIPADAGEIYLRFEIVDANNKVHMVKMYGNTEAFRAPERKTVNPVWGKDVEGAPVPAGQWIIYEAELPQDIDYVYGEGFIDVGYFAPGDRYKITPERMIPIKQVTISLDAAPDHRLAGREGLAVYIDRVEFIGYEKQKQAVK